MEGGGSRPSNVLYHHSVIRKPFYLLDSKKKKGGEGGDPFISKYNPGKKKERRASTIRERKLDRILSAFRQWTGRGKGRRGG